MDQSSVIGAALVIAYVVFVIAKGELPCYLSVLGISSAATCPPSLQQPGCGAASTTSTPSVGITIPSGGTTSGGVNFPGGGSVGIGINPPGGRGMSLGGNTTIGGL